MSIAGGLPRAVARAVLHGCESLQIFTRSTGRWQARAFFRRKLPRFVTRQPGQVCVRSSHASHQ
jgi:hypothetical protein